MELLTGSRCARLLRACTWRLRGRLTRGRIRGGLGALLGCLILIGAEPAARATTTPLADHAIKAAFLYKFTQFTEWPADAFAEANQPLVFGVLGHEALAEELRAVARGRTAQGRPIVVRAIRRAQEVRTCHIVFVGAGADDRVPDVLRTIGTAGVLTVGESAGFADAGGMVNFVVEDARVRLEVNLAATERGRIRLSSKLLRVAKIVARSPS